MYFLLVYSVNASNTYDLVWDDLVSGSLDDNYEEIDNMISIQNFSSIEGIWLITINGIGTQADYDQYKIQITSGSLSLVVDLTFLNSQGNIDLAIYDSIGTLIANSVLITVNELIDYILPSNGTYYILVYGADANKTYDLWWDNFSENTPPNNDVLGFNIFVLIGIILFTTIFFIMKLRIRIFKIKNFQCYYK